MSLEEMETAWANQSTPPVDEPAARECIARNRRRIRTTAILLFSTALFAFVNLGLKIDQVLRDPDRTFANTSGDLIIAGLCCLLALFGARQFLRGRRELIALGNDTRRCLEAIIESTRGEITALRVGVPLAYAGFLGLLGLAKLQAIAAGHETTGNAWSGLVLAVVVMIVMTAILHHRVDAFLRPRLAALEQTRRALTSA